MNFSDPLFRNTIASLGIAEVLVHPDNAKKSIERRRKPYHSEMVTEPHVWPNPASDFVLINHRNLPRAGGIIVYDSQGRVVIQQAISTESKTTIINIELLENGNYLIEIKDEQGQPLSSEQLIIME